MDSTWLSLLPSSQWSINFWTAFPFLIGHNKLGIPAIGGLYLAVFASFLPVIHELLDCFLWPVFLGQQNSWKRLCVVGIWDISTVFYFLKIQPHSAFTAFGALLPSESYSARWSGRVWQPFADCHSRSAHLFLNLKCAKRPLKSSKLKSKKSTPNGHFNL